MLSYLVKTILIAHHGASSIDHTVVLRVSTYVRLLEKLTSKNLSRIFFHLFLHSRHI